MFSNIPGVDMTVGPEVWVHSWLLSERLDVTGMHDVRVVGSDDG